jgi:hypothetical protein
MTREFGAVRGVLKKVLLVVAVLLGLVVAVFCYSVRLDQQRFRSAANPCERDCVQDSGGLDDCRRLCVSHPMTYGPASQRPSH